MSVLKLFDAEAAAKRLRRSGRWVRKLCETGRLGTRIARSWVITEAELRAFKPHPRGRPKGWRKKRV